MQTLERNSQSPEPSSQVDAKATAPDFVDIQSNRMLTGRSAVVTGASSGIGRAIAIALSHQGAHVHAIGRDPVALAETSSIVRQFSSVTDFQIDLTNDEELRPLLDELEGTGKLDILIHCAGIIEQGSTEHAHVEDLDRQYATNVRAPYLLTQRVLPLLISSQGQIVFINSSVGVNAKLPRLAQYAATKHALKAVADSLREEVNPRGIRVLSVYAGRTATPMQQSLYEEQEISYRPELLLQPEHIASVVIHALTLPSTAEITDIHIRPLQKTY